MSPTINFPLHEELEALTPDQKWQAFQFLWQEVAESHTEQIEPPGWHEEILKERDQKIAEGKAEWLDFDQAMDQLESEFR